MRLIKTVFGAVILISGLSGAVQAQSIYGAGGLFLNPTANFAPKGSITPSALTLAQDGPGALGGRTQQTTYGVSYAATDQLEVGASYAKLSPGGAKPDGSFGLFAKYQLMQGEVGGRPDIAIGGNFLAGGDLDARTAFLATRYTPRTSFHDKHLIHLHGGLIYADKYYGIDRTDIVPYAGMDVGLTSNLTAFAEIRGRMSSDNGQPGDVETPTAVGLSWRPSGSYTIAVVYGNNGQSRDNKFGIGVGFTLGSQGGSGERKTESPTPAGLVAQSTPREPLLYLAAPR